MGWFWDGPVGPLAMSSDGAPGHLSMHAKNLADLYDLPVLDWAMVTGRLDAGISQAPDTGGPNRHSC